MENIDQTPNLDARMKDLEGKIDTLTEVMVQMNEELKKIARGLYGDEANNTEGLIARQLKDEEKIKSLENRVKDLEQLFKDSLLKKRENNQLLDKVKKWAIITGIVILGAKETVGFDAIAKFIVSFFLK